MQDDVYSYEILYGNQSNNSINMVNIDGAADKDTV